MNSPGGRADDCLTGGGEMGALMRAFDWSASSVGEPSQWPQSLRTAVSICINSRFPIVLWWGGDFTTFYNDAYTPIMGPAKHPLWLGRSGRECWSEIWDVIGPMLDRVIGKGEATWSENLLLPIHRILAREEGYFTFSYSPIRDESGAVAGVFCAVSETTGLVISERRLRTLTDIETAASGVETPAGLCAGAARVLEGNKADVPFALIYLIDENGKTAHLAGAAGIEPGARAAPIEMSLEADDSGNAWPIAEVLKTASARIVDGLEGRLGPLPGGLWPESPDAAWLIPFPPSGAEGGGGLLIAGLSPRRIIDAEYRSFFDLVANHLAAAIANVRALETERKRAAALAEIDRAKTVFFSNISHEFRTPLTLIIGSLEDAIARSEAPGGAHPLRTAHRNAMRLLRLVNNLLDFSRIEAGRANAVFEPLDLARLTRDLASSFDSLMRRAGLSFTIECETPSGPAFVDREMWEKIVLNLLSNAFKFTLAGGISIKLREDGDRIELSVSDTGCGIAADELLRLFERFHRVEGARARTYEGSGIGLALVNELVKMHGGEIRVTSKAGEGSTFTVSIPAGNAHPPNDRAGAGARPDEGVRGAAVFVDEAARWLGNPDAIGGLASSGADGRDLAGGPGDVRILLADDSADMRDYVTRLLQPLYTVETAADGVEALRIARLRRPDLVLTDVMMPSLDGFGLLRELRADPLTHSIPVIMLSARSGEEDKIEGFEHRADDYLVKPFSSRELLARITAHVSLARERDEINRVLRKGGERLALAAAAAGLGIYEWDVENDRPVWENEQMYSIFGRSLDDGPLSNEEFLRDVVHPDDAPEIRRKLLPGASLFHATCRITRKSDGDLRWIELNGRFANGADGGGRRLLGVVRDITDQKMAEEERRTLLQSVVEARNAAEEASTAKDDFLAMLGHELRNPLSPILTAIKIMGLRGDPGNREHALIERQVNLLAELVDDLLDVARVTRGKIQLRKKPLELAPIVASAIEMASPLIEQRAHRVEAAVASRGLLIDADPTRLAQVISNLLTNAAKYTNPGGRIRISAVREENTIAVRVRDNGIGIRPDLLPRVFDLFRQGTRDIDRAEGGLGIGLALVKSLVTLHGGSVTAYSDGPDRGSEFIVRLPALDASAPLTRMEDKNPVKPEKFTARRVLVIDDNEDAAETLAELLEAYGHVAKALYDGPSALLEVRRFKPDVLFVDIGLPVMDGYELARRLRQMPELASARLIAITGYGQDSDRLLAAEAGFDAHLVKPVDLEKLRSLLNADDAN
jgi:PAS domain S-box-containing protein